MRIDTFGGALGLFIIAIAVIFGGAYVVDCFTNGACK